MCRSVRTAFGDGALGRVRVRTYKLRPITTARGWPPGDSSPVHGRHIRPGIPIVSVRFRRLSLFWSPLSVFGFRVRLTPRWWPHVLSLHRRIVPPLWHLDVRVCLLKARLHHNLGKLSRESTPAVARERLEGVLRAHVIGACVLAVSGPLLGLPPQAREGWYFCDPFAPSQETQLETAGSCTATMVAAANPVGPSTIAGSVASAAWQPPLSPCARILIHARAPFAALLLPCPASTTGTATRHSQDAVDTALGNFPGMPPHMRGGAGR